MNQFSNDAGTNERPPPTITYVDIDLIKDDGPALKIHPEHQQEILAKAIREFGIIISLVVDKDFNLVAGRGRLEAARRLGLKKVPVLIADHLSPEELRAYAIADNKIAEGSTWDSEVLKVELIELSNIDFDLSLTGFELPEIDLLVYGDTAQAAEEAPTEPQPKAVSREGDVWVMGRHRVICGDALTVETYKALLGDDVAHAVFTDPPYNVPVDGHVSGNGKIKHREFAMASGEMSEDEFREFLMTTCNRIAENMADGAMVYICMDWRHGTDLDLAGRAVFAELKNVIVWDKGVGGMGSLYRSQHELIYVYKAHNGAHTNNVELGRHGRNRTNVWAYPGVQSRRKDLTYHPTVKPIGMVADALLDVTQRGEIVLDPFLGSGTTLLAAERVGRVAYGIELDPLYVDVALRRFRGTYGIEPTLEATGENFTERERATLEHDDDE
ncbi:DNA methyltransferase [Henriciella sp.]|uniref:site-specific DNA-methyltransferase n=1 Tax=Henriciella sp. TaxID=1968823 RepID=UPI00262DCF18|nr:DNA methyltransferase [Henriciella sp.]